MLTKGLNQDYLNDSSLKVFFRSHWNFVFIVVISNETSTTCVDGKLEDDGLLRIQKFFNDIWHTHTLINVIMTFPVSCPNTYVIYDGKQKTNASLYDRTIKLVQPRSFTELFQYISDSGKELSEGYPLRAGMFNRFPTSITKCDKIHYYVPYNKDITDGFCGSDGLIMQDTLKYFKFNTIFSRDKNCDRYGYMNRVKGTVTGSLGCVINGKIDISFNSRFMVPYTDERFNYIYFISYDSLCAVLSIPEAHPLWYYPLNDLDLKSWLLILAIIFTVAVVTKILQSSKKDLKEKNSFKILFYDYFACMLLGFSLSRKSNHCILRGGCLCASIVFLAIYQGHINFRFTTLTRYPKIKTLQELYASNNVLYTSASVRDLLRPLENPNNTMQAAFLKKTKLHLPTDIGRLIQAMYRSKLMFCVILKIKDSVTLGRKTDVITEISLNYLSDNGTPLVYQVDQCFDSYYLSYISKFGFPFTKQLRIFIQRLLEAGLPNAYYRWTTQALGRTQKWTDQKVEPRTFSKITMQDQRIPFCLLLFGYIVATITFAFEKFR
ncbi:uncharacterized protein LOC114244817 [Bombyx mandarina]|uniref:Uncharacterized protein LOC114244817 n=1 Tax=Bombyx mandarina TaxID=7092 RepID=A0A6J2JWG7_BOMMA|nr:uncharacterized protein LOC114244817 [Bombyx mandarina]